MPAFTHVDSGSTLAITASPKTSLLTGPPRHPDLCHHGGGRSPRQQPPSSPGHWTQGSWQPRMQVDSVFTLAITASPKNSLPQWATSLSMLASLTVEVIIAPWSPPPLWTR